MIYVIMFLQLLVAVAGAQVQKSPVMFPIQAGAGPPNDNDCLGQLWGAYVDTDTDEVYICGASGWKKAAVRPVHEGELNPIDGPPATLPAELCDSVEDESRFFVDTSSEDIYICTPAGWRQIAQAPTPQFPPTTIPITTTTLPLCGNNTLDAGEQCDPPDVAGPCTSGSCQSNCQCPPVFTQVCGNSIVEGTEECDNSACTTGTCLSNCGCSIGTVYYLSPSGSDSNTGLSVGSPWQHFSKVLNSSRPLVPGDTVILLNGTYTPSVTGLPSINCNTNARNGTQTAPITIMAQSERQVHLSSNAFVPGLYMQDCAWWNFYGLRASSTDSTSAGQAGGYPMRFLRVSNVSVKRSIVHRPNRKQNCHALAVEDSSNMLLEDIEAYDFHRHGYSVFRSRFITMRRLYANSRLPGNVGCCSTIDNRNNGDEAISMYGISDSIVENCISENQANGFQMHGIENSLDPSGSGGRRNRVLGSVSLGDAVPLLASSRVVGATYRNALNNTLRNFVSANYSGNGAYFRGVDGVVVENSTIFNSTANSGLVFDSGDSGYGGTCGSGNPQGCSLDVKNTLSFSHGSGIGFSISGVSDWTLDYVNSADNSTNYSPSETLNDQTGHIQNSITTTPTSMGLSTNQCLMWVPAGSNMKGAGQGGADIGANILFRYKDGILTPQPLWDPTTGAFPCGADVAGLNDVSGDSCKNVHLRLNVDENGCVFPAGYGTPTTSTTSTSLAGSAQPDWSSFVDYVWRMEEADSATRVNTGSGTNGNLTDNNGVTREATLKQEGTYAAGFNDLSPGDKLTNTTASAPSLGYTGAFVFGCWVRTQETDYDGVIGRTDNVNVGYTLAVDGGTQKALFKLWDNALPAPKNCDCETGSGAIPINTYKHIVGIWDGTKIFVYVNGTKKDCTYCQNCTGPVSGSCNRSTITAGGVFTIGGAGTGTLSPFGGQIDECFTDTGWSDTSASNGVMDPQALCRICSCGVNGAACTCSGASYTNSGRNVSCGSCTLPACNQAQP
jgi:Concanavalin A-like lectin/glucanases superfamily